MATYVNDLRLKEIGTGESSGTWGSETNVNLELIGEALGFGTEAITTNADTHTTTVADGSTDPGRAMYLKYTGTLDSACTITIGPNTISRMQFIENGTSGSQNIIISQGTGANVTIPAGDVKAVYLDGAGSGAAVVDAFASLNVVDLKVEDDLTVTDDLTFSSDSAVVTFGADGDTTLTHTDGTGLTLNSTNKLCFNDASQFVQGSSATVLSLGATDEIDLTATAIDVNGTMDVSGAITSSAGATITVSDNSDNLTLTSTDADANSGPNLRLYRNSSSPADDDVVGVIDFEGRNNNSQDVIYANIQGEIMQEADGSEDGQLQFGVMKAGTLRNAFMIDRTEVAINEDSVDINFRVESNGDANMLFVDGGEDRVGIGTGTPGFTFDLQKSLSESYSATGRPTALARVMNTNSADNNHATIEFGTEPSSGNGGVGFIGSTVTASNLANLFFGTRTGASSFATHMTIKSDGDTRIGTSTDAYVFAQKLIVGDANDNEGITIQSGTTHQGNIAFNDGGTTAKGRISYQQSTNFMAFFVNNSEKFRVDTNGRLMIGLTSAIDAANLTVQSNGGNGLAIGSADSANAYRHIYHTTSSGILSFASTGNTASLSNAGAWTNASDIAYKKDIVDTQYGLETIKALQPRDYKLKETNEADTGFIAQELETHLPQFVEGEDGSKTLNYGQLTAVLVKAIQELEARITTLEG